MGFAFCAIVGLSLQRPYRRPSSTRGGRTGLPPLCLCAAVAAALAAALPPAHAATVTSTWIGGEGSWTDLAHWSNTPAVAQYPNNGSGGHTYDVTLSDGPVLLNTSVAIDMLFVATDLTLNTGTSLTANNGVTLDNAAIKLNPAGGASYLYFSEALGGTGEIVLNGTSSNNRVAPTGSGTPTPTLGPGITVRTGTQGGWLGSSTRKWINQGTISAQTASKTITVEGKDWVNEGLMEAKNGSTLTLNGTWSNDGVLESSDGAMLILNGTWTNAGLLNVNSRMIVRADKSDGNAVRNALYATLLDQLKLARSQGWDPVAVSSSAAHDDKRLMTSVGLVLNDNGEGKALLASFGGQAINTDSILLKYTWLGDANLDGVVNADDYFLIDSNYIPQNPGWYNGDFNYDNVINADDYFLIDSAFLSQTGPLCDPSFLPSSSPIPEPSLLLPLLSLTLLPRRRRIHRFLPPFRLPPSPP